MWVAAHADGADNATSASSNRVAWSIHEPVRAGSAVQFNVTLPSQTNRSRRAAYARAPDVRNLPHLGLRGAMALSRARKYRITRYTNFSPSGIAMANDTGA